MEEMTMSKILELRSKRNTLWEQTKAFLEQHRGENGLVAADAVEQLLALRVVEVATELGPAPLALVPALHLG